MRRETWVILGWLAVALLVRLRHLDWGFPEVFEEATPVREAIGFWGEPGGRVDLNPHFFKYPSLTFYMNFMAQAVWYLLASLQGSVDSLNGFRQVLRDEFSTAVILGRGISAGLGALIVVPVMSLARRLSGSGGAVLAGGLWALLPVAVSESQVVGPDVALALLGAAALVSATRLVDSGDRGDSLWCGVWIGLAAAAKYPGAILIVALLTAQAVVSHRRGEGAIGVLGSGALWQGLLVSGAVFAAASPYVLLDLSTASQDILFERRHMSLGHLGREDGRAWFYYLGRALPGGWTPAVSVAAVLGVAGLLGRRATRARTLPGVVFGAVLLLVLGSWTMAAPRYILPLAPLGVVWAASAVAGLVVALRPRHRTVSRLAWALAAVLLAWPLAVTIHQVAARGRPDSRLAAQAWIEAEVPEGRSILLERYGPELDGKRYLLVHLPFHGVTPHIYDPAYSSPLYASFDYVVLSSGVSSRYLNRPREYPAQVRFYADLDRAFREVASFPAGEYVGPGIRILERRDVPFPGLDAIPAEFFVQVRGSGPLAEYFSTLGTSLVRQGLEDQGFRILRESVDIDPESAQAWGNLGVMELERGRHQEALNALRRARDLDRNDARSAYNLGNLYSAMGELRQAADAYRETILIDPSFEVAYTSYARVLVEDDRFSQAASVLRHFLDRFPQSSRRPMAEAALRELRNLGPGRP